MAALRNVVIGLGILSARREYQSVTILLTLFLALFGATSATERSAQIVAGVYAAAAIGWLLASHWETVSLRLILQKSESRVRTPISVIAVATLVLVIAIPAVGGRPITRAIRGWLPSSGGDGQSSEFARSGVGDGEMLVAGAENIQSFGPLEDAPFMTDDRPSLYDVFDDSYEEPVRPNQNQDRSIALGSNVEVRRSKEHIHTETQKANREFSTRRQPAGRADQTPMKSIHSDALLYVAGRVPLHLRMEQFSQFDGTTWTAPPVTASPMSEATIVRFDGKPWLKLRDRANWREDLGQAETHALKIVRMETNVVPAPPNLHGVHIDHVDRLDMYQVQPGPRVRLQRKKLPELVPIHVASRSVDAERAAASALFETVSHDAGWPASLDADRWRLTAAEWTRGCRSRSDMVTAIERRLRENYVHDPDWRASPDSGSPVDEFLFESRRGPDYLFATAAALLLRTLHFDTQVVGGFYASPDAYDVRSRHTPVATRDAHLWAEARLVGGDWMTIEPTPGYFKLEPAPGWGKWLMLQTAGLIRATARHWLIAWLAILGLTVAVIRRRQSIDALDELIWKWWPSEGPARKLRAFALLERRAARAGMTRSPSEDAERWLQRLCSSGSEGLRREALLFGRAVNAAAFSPVPDHHPPGSATLDRTLVDTLSLNWFLMHQSIKSTPRQSRRRVNSATVCVALFLFGGLPIVSSGCGQKPEADSRLEHEHPPHQPHSFADAVEEIGRRSANPSLEGDAQAKHELDDILNWTPDLAADTNLRKADWERAVGAVEQFKAWRAASSQAKPQPAPESALKILQDLAATAGAR